MTGLTIVSKAKSSGSSSLCIQNTSSLLCRGYVLPYLSPITPALKYFLSWFVCPIILLFAFFFSYDVYRRTVVRKYYHILIGVPLGAVRRDCCFMFRDYAGENLRFTTTRAIAIVVGPPGWPWYLSYSLCLSFRDSLHLAKLLKIDAI